MDVGVDDWLVVVVYFVALEMRHQRKQAGKGPLDLDQHPWVPMGTALWELPWTNTLANRGVAADQHIHACNFLSMSCSVDSGEVGNSMIQYLDNLKFLTVFFLIWK